MKPHTLETQILDYLNARQLEEVSEEDQVRKAKDIERVFTLGVDFLRVEFPNPAINRLMGIVSDVVKQRVAPVCSGLKVPTLSFILAGVKTAPQAMIATPANWVDMVRKDPLTQLGALVYVGSQAVDYANDRFLGERPNVAPRAKAYEAEYLNTVKGLTPTWEPVTYQADTLSEFPDGILSPKAHKVLYSLRPLISA
jgi:hypothetical protein